MPPGYGQGTHARAGCDTGTVDVASLLASPATADAIERCADPNAAREALIRIVEAHPEAGERVRDDLELVEGLVAIACASRALTNAIVGDGSLVAVVGDRPSLAKERTVAEYEGAAGDAGTGTDATGAALRRWKRREYLRIATRDLLHLADLPAVGRELAALAGVCLESAVSLTTPMLPFTVIGMGKLGGSELNYASDIDVLFVSEGDGDEAERVARAVLSVMTTPTPDGIVFRTDPDLRPEGRAGALVRSVDGYRAWYERWARPWEFQALIKARPVAGDCDLGESFMELIGPFVWPDVLDPEAIREARAMKARAEAELQRKGLSDRELKRGRGGIRDVEFAVQLLQRVHGREDTSIRSRSTLDALDQLAAGGYIRSSDASRLAGAYTFLRTVEHRLQLWDEQQTHTLPSDPDALTRLARVLGYRDAPGATAVEAFETAQRGHQTTVRSIHERLFFAPILETLAGSGALSAAAAEERLVAFGFHDAEHTRAALRELTQGLTRRSRLMQQLLPVILDWLSGTPDPDLGLLQLRKLAEGPTRAAALATTFGTKPSAAERACRVLGSSRWVGDLLLRQPEVVELLGNDGWLVHERERALLIEGALETLRWREGSDARRQGLRRFKRRQLLRIASRDLLGLAPIESTTRELADIADACVEAALRSLEPTIPFAVIGLGRLGGHELSYASDIDVLFVYDGDGAAAFDAAEQTAGALVKEIGQTTSEGQTFRIDANLRPEGKQGPLARSLDGYRQYYERWALTWEFQSLLRARAVAGDPEVAARFLAMIEPFVFRDPFPPEEAREVRRIKARVERERIPPGEDPQFHLKLGKGSLTDIEFTVQLLQLEHGATHPDVREPSTRVALEKLRDAGLLENDDERILSEAYRFCERARNARYLIMGSPGEALPTGADATRLARLLGYTHSPEAELRDDYRRVTRRARRVVERVFYGRGGTEPAEVS
jgi:glutamate-ammonia-ligase adenylyltransferase